MITEGFAALMAPDEPYAVARMLRAMGTPFRVPVVGNSMRPLIRDGDHVRVRAGVPPRVGDIVVAQTASGLVVHRVIRVACADVVLRGDNMPHHDAPVRLDDVVGRVVAVEGDHFRRIDTNLAQVSGRLAAAAARAAGALGHAGCRVRPARIGGAYVRASRLLWPPARPEDMFPLRLAGTLPADRAAAHDLTGIARPVDWNLVAERALLGQIGPQVCIAARGLQCSRPPKEALHALCQQYVANLSRNRRAMQILDAMLERLEAVGIQALAHKGVALTAQVYPDPALRVMGDIDLSVRDSDRERAAVAVRDIRDELVRANPSRRSPSGFHVELDGTAHHDIDPAAFGRGRWCAESLDWDRIWDHARPQSFGSRTVLVPCPTDLLLTLIANSVRRGFSPVRLVVDISRTIQVHRNVINWTELEAELQRTRLDRRSWIALELANQWCGTRVPIRFLEPPADLCMAVFERQMLNWKLRRPFARLPTRVLWAGSWRAAAATSANLLARQLARRPR